MGTNPPTRVLLLPRPLLSLLLPLLSGLWLLLLLDLLILVMSVRAAAAAAAAACGGARRGTGEAARGDVEMKAVRAGASEGE